MNKGDIITNKWCRIPKPSVVKFGKHKPSDMSKEYNCGHLGFYIEHPWDTYKITRQDILYFADECIVVGNIYENPELLEVKKNELQF